MKYFNTAGPCEPHLHYMIPAAERLPEAPGLIARNFYFVVHAPRQTGKTTTLRAIAKALTAEGKVAALHFSCETGEPLHEDVAAVERAVLQAMHLGAASVLPDDCLPPRVREAPAGTLLLVNLTTWAASCPRPLVLFFDEIDSLQGNSLNSVLRQLRAGYPNRPGAFPGAVVLCGLRDVRDYKVAAGGDPHRLGTSSPFNIKVDSLRLGNFTCEEVATLYGQHAEESGQQVAPEAVSLAWSLTEGQPWLVNALAREIVEKMGIVPPSPIQAHHVEEARERLILARATHLDSLVARLLEPRVRKIIEPVIAGSLVGGDSYDDDFQYVRDLGLVAQGRPTRIANPIYHEVIVRVLAASAEENMGFEPRTFVRSDGGLNMDLLLQEFAAFWKEHGEILTSNLPYHEIAPQLVLMAFLQRVVNGGGYVDREYGVGRGRIDLLIRWPLPPSGEQAVPAVRSGARRWQREALELKAWSKGKPDPLKKGLEQLDGYLHRLQLQTGILILFDRRPNAPPMEDRVAIGTATAPSGRPITILRA